MSDTDPADLLGVRNRLIVRLTVERNEARATVARVRALCEQAEANPHGFGTVWISAIRAALDPPTDGA